jgi:predicted nucleic acid-binding protein
VILCDTGPLVAAFNAADRDHGRCAEFLRANWSRLVIPSLAVTEVCTCSPTRSAADVKAWLPSFALRSPKTSCG